MTRRTSVANIINIKIAEGNSKATDVYMDGGFLDMWNSRFGLGHWASSVRGARATLTIDGSARAFFYLAAFGSEGVGNMAVLNLRGGRFELSRGFATYGNTGNMRFFNLDGGTLALVRDTRSGYIGGLDTTCRNIVYPGCVTIEVPKSPAKRPVR